MGHAPKNAPWWGAGPAVTRESEGEDLEEGAHGEEDSCGDEDDDNDAGDGDIFNLDQIVDACRHEGRMRYKCRWEGCSMMQMQT